MLDLLGRRWTLRILWELRPGPLTFRALQVRCDEVSPTSLNARLAELREAQLIESGEGGYAMTPLGAWSERWARHLGGGDPADRG
ncbi:MAG: helix-turn-helix transcriptional regulator [Gammaproteobacteria bacterium]|nr:helix-turn-helix transcriptional regulator [Gammaproteobacteria bacterium]